MNNMLYPYMNDNNMMNIPFQYNKIIELEQRINRIDRELHKLNKRVNNLENKKMMPLSSTPNIDINDSSNLYMV